jgi:Ca-activated chloride channel family protein
MVLFSDGGQTAGLVTPQQAAAKAAKAHVPVTAVAVGTPDGIVQQPLRGGFVERFQVPVRPAVLQSIARTSGGRFVTGAQGVNVKATYSRLSARTGHRRKAVEVTSVAAAGGLVFMLAGGLLSGLWFRRLT